MNERACTLCKKTYVKRKSESVERFSYRLYCSVGCSRKAQRSNPRRFGSIFYGQSDADFEARLDP